MMMHRVQQLGCLETGTGPEEHRNIIACMQYVICSILMISLHGGHIVDLAMNCYGCYVLQKALDCREEEVSLLIVSELPRGDPATTLVNKHASHVWSKYLVPPLLIDADSNSSLLDVNKSFKGKWAALACHETGSLVMQHGFENLEESAKDGIVDELLGQGAAVFGEVAKSQWGSIQHILEHGSEKHRQMALEQPLTGLLEKETLERAVQLMCEPAKGTARRAMIVDLALSLTGSHLIASVPPTADKDQCVVIWLMYVHPIQFLLYPLSCVFSIDRMRAYYGY
ncbi:armadillo-type protein [Mycena leptocephala]|nr:armadillo-type protein [Mycena leptocephala]